MNLEICYSNSSDYTYFIMIKCDEYAENIIRYTSLIEKLNRLKRNVDSFITYINDEMKFMELLTKLKLEKEFNGDYQKTENKFIELTIYRSKNIGSNLLKCIDY